MPSLPFQTKLRCCKARSHLPASLCTTFSRGKPKKIVIILRKMHLRKGKLERCAEEKEEICMFKKKGNLFLSHDCVS